MADPGVRPERYTVIATDAHAGPLMQSFRPYFEKKYWPAFDDHVRDREAQRAAVRAGLGSRKRPGGAADRLVPSESHESLQPGGHPGLGDSSRRLRDLDAEGIAAEVIFPDFPHVVSHEPPFGGVTSGRRLAGGSNQRTNEFYDPELQMAGAKAYNRWLADFCSAQPERHAGIALTPFHDVEAAVDEIGWAHKAGLRGGVLLPGIHPLEPGYNDPRYEPIWAVCEDLGMALNCHGGNELPDFGSGPTAALVHGMESKFWAHRPLWWIMLGGILERHPRLSLVFAEQDAEWVPSTVRQLDQTYQKRTARAPDLEFSLGGRGYWDRQCYVTARFTRKEVEMRHEIGLTSMMWGSDYPHPEGTWPFSREALRYHFASVPPDEMKLMVGETAARVYHFDLEKLSPIAQRIGPTVEEVGEPLNEVPAGYSGRGFG